MLGKGNMIVQFVYFWTRVDTENWKMSCSLGRKDLVEKGWKSEIYQIHNNDTNFDYYAKYHECFLKQGLLINTSMCAVGASGAKNGMKRWSVTDGRTDVKLKIVV